MKLQSITLRSFRNHTQSSFECSDGHNILVGRNGQGKTNVLEAISYLCLGRSFFAANDAIVLQRGKEEFSVRGTLQSDGGVIYLVEANYNSTQGFRKLRIGGADLQRRSELIGMFPVVVLAPESAPITSGGPGDRRRMVDTTLAQAQRSYLEDVVEYRKALRQRNKVLFDAKLTRRFDEQALAPWTDLLVERGARITKRRQSFIEEFQPYVSRAVSALSGEVETPTITYQPSIGVGVNGTPDDGKDVFREHLRAVKQDEARAGTTLIGPHRDEFDLEINGYSVRQYASQGQHKTFLVGLKFAEFHFLKNACGETPLLLLDDVLSELDPERNRHVFDLTRHAGQIFLTAADPRLLPAGGGDRHRVFRVTDGNIEHGDDEDA